MQYNESTRDLHFSKTFMRSFAEQHYMLRQFVDGMGLLLTSGTDEQRSHGWQTLKVAWSAYYREFGDGAEALGHFTRASLAAGASVSSNGGTAPNCVHCALGDYIGASDARGGIPEALNHALVGWIRKTAAGRNECVNTTLWPEVLRDLGFGHTDQPIVGDLVVYTILGGAALTDEYAVHFGRVVAPSDPQQQQQYGIMVESKSGYAFDTYVHPLNVVDPTYLISSPCMRVHFFRPLREPLPGHRLSALAKQYAERLTRQSP